MFTGGHRTRVAAVTLDNMAEDAVAASASLWQIITVSVRYCGPAFVSWLSMLWDTLTRNSELQWFGISPQSRLKVSHGDEGVGDVCFPGDEGVGRPWRGYRCMQMNVGPAWYLELLLNLVLCIYFWIQNHIKRFYHILVWSFGHICIIAWPFEGNCFELFFSKGNIFAHAGKWFDEHYRLFSHSFTRISKLVLEFKMCFSSETVEFHFNLPAGFYVICVNYTLKHRALSRNRISLNLYMSFSAQNTLSQNDLEIPAWTMLYELKGFFVIHVDSLIFKTIHRILSRFWRPTLSIWDLILHCRWSINYLFFYHCSMNWKCNVC